MIRRFLQEVFGDTFRLESYECPKALPLFMHDDYDTSLLSWDEAECVLLCPRYQNWRLSSVKKHLAMLQETVDKPCALHLDHVSTLQRRNLIESRTPFITDGEQLYLPFWGMVFAQRLKEYIPVPDKMAPATQMLFLHYYHNCPDEPVNATELARMLGISKASMTRALRHLISLELLEEKAQGRAKMIFMTKSKDEYLANGIKHMNTPVDKVVYADQLPDIPMLKSGMRALADITTIGLKQSDGAYAICIKDLKDVDEYSMISREQFEDFGGYVIEVWNYDPALFAVDDRVDDVSLLVSMTANENERIQLALDEIRSKLGLPAEE